MYIDEHESEISDVLFGVWKKITIKIFSYDEFPSEMVITDHKLTFIIQLGHILYYYFKGNKL